MRIGILAQLLSYGDDYRQAGVSRYIEYLLHYLPDVLGTDDELLALAGSQARYPERLRQLPASIEWHWSRWPTRRVPVRIMWEQLAAPWITRQQSVDLVHGPVNVVPLGTRARSVVTIHDLAFLAYPEQYPAMQRRYLYALTRRSVQKADRVVTVSEYTGQDVAERLGIDQRKIVSIPNGVSEEFYPRRDSEVAAFRINSDLPEEFLLFVGTLQPRKNLIGLLRAYAMLDRANRLPLYVVGAPGWMFRDIFEEVETLEIGQDVHFPGYATSDSLPLWYSAATAFIYPSFYEGFGLPVLEAMACGTPVITSSTSSLPEVVGDAGLLVSPESPEAIADAIRTVLDDSGERRRLSACGVERAKQFTWKRTAQETANVYHAVMNER